ncbi:MAG: sigma-70 family RNA polymerase sigma factor [Gammaproteobacteria bacterium]
MAELLARCARQDATALERLYRAAAPKLYGVSLALLKNEASAEDVLQDSFIKIWSRAGSYNPAKGAAMTWMTSIVRNRALDLLRSTRMQADQLTAQFEEQEFASSEQGPLEAASMQASTSAVIACLNELPEQQRRCIMMAYYYGHTHDELARRTDNPLGTVKAWVRRGMERLRKCLE